MIRVGQKLAEARFKKGLNLEDVSQATKIKTDFLAAIEEGKYDQLPSFAYAQGFVRNYAKYVGLPEREALALFRREFDSDNAIKVLPQAFARDYNSSTIRKNQTLILICLVFLIVFGFIIYQYRAAFLSPSLSVISPKDNTVASNMRVVVVGKTDPEATVLVNNNPVAVDENGNFTKNLNLFTGKAEITIKSVNKFGKTSTVIRDIDVK
jgi:cytoskeletal protein RodZ